MKQRLLIALFLSIGIQIARLLSSAYNQKWKCDIIYLADLMLILFIAVRYKIGKIRLELYYIRFND